VVLLVSVKPDAFVLAVVVGTRVENDLEDEVVVVVVVMGSAVVDCVDEDEDEDEDDDDDDEDDDEDDDDDEDEDEDEVVEVGEGVVNLLVSLICVVSVVISTVVCCGGLSLVVVFASKEEDLIPSDISCLVGVNG